LKASKTTNGIAGQRTRIRNQKGEIMKYTVEVEDFFMDEDDDLSKKLNDYVVHQVITQIWEKINKKVDDEIRLAVQAYIERELTAKINARIADIVMSEKIKKDGKEQMVVDYIKDRFINNSGWTSPIDQITKLAKEYGNEMKKRYDYLYANQIVQQMRNIGVIKEEIFANLIEGKTQK
jgi:hypothetical protein